MPTDNKDTKKELTLTAEVTPPTAVSNTSDSQATAADKPQHQMGDAKLPADAKAESIGKFQCLDNFNQYLTDTEKKIWTPDMIAVLLANTNRDLLKTDLPFYTRQLDIIAIFLNPRQSNSYVLVTMPIWYPDFDINNKTKLLSQPVGLVVVFKGDQDMENPHYKVNPRFLDALINGAAQYTHVEHGGEKKSIADLLEFYCEKGNIRLTKIIAFITPPSPDKKKTAYSPKLLQIDSNYKHSDSESIFKGFIWEQSTDSKTFDTKATTAMIPVTAASAAGLAHSASQQNLTGLDVDAKSSGATSTPR